MRIEKAAGKDNKVLEFIIYRGQEVKQWILDLFRQVWKEGTISKVWERNIITCIHKKMTHTQMQKLQHHMPCTSSN